MPSAHTIDVPHFEDLLATSGGSAESLERELRLLLAVKLFELKRVSTGQAAAIAGLDKLIFIDELGRLGVPLIDFDLEQCDAEFQDD